jgi:WD40 repeat protein
MLVEEWRGVEELDMFRKPEIVCFLMALILLFMGCAPQPDSGIDTGALITTVSPDQTGSSQDAGEIPTPADIVQAISTSTLPANSTTEDITHTLVGSAPPALLYIRGSELLEQTIGEAPKRVGSLLDGGSVKNAIQIGDNLLVLCEDGIQRITLPDGAAEFLLKSDTRVLFGDFSLLSDKDQVLYTAVLDDPRSDFGMSTVFGFYQVGQNTLGSSFTIPQNLRVLGFSPDEQGLYLLPIGQDPEFGSVLLFDLGKRNIIKELPIEGQGFASLAPDYRMLATTSTRCIECDQPEGVVNLYDLPSLPLTPPLALALPFTPSHISSLAWSPDGSRLYFLLVDGNPWDEPVNTYGLWQLGISSDSISQVAPLYSPLIHIRTISPDGKWLLLEHEARSEAILVNLLSGEAQTFNRPESALTVLWR